MVLKTVISFLEVAAPAPIDPIESIFMQLQSNDTMKLLEACTSIKRDLDARSRMSNCYYFINSRRSEIITL